MATVPDATEWSSFDFELINSSASRSASMSLFVNDIFVVSKSFTTFVAPDTAPLPNLSEIVDGNKYVWGCRAATAGAGFFVGPYSVQMGRFTRAGVELLE